MKQTSYYPVAIDSLECALECVPPIYIKWLKVGDHERKISGFAVSEAMTYANGTVVCSVYFQEGGEAYKAICEIRTPDGGNIDDTYNHQYGRGYIASCVQINESDQDSYLFREHAKIAA